jgi:hypothetical protein
MVIWCNVTRLLSSWVAITPDGRGARNTTRDVDGISVFQVIVAVPLLWNVLLTPEIVGMPEEQGAAPVANAAAMTSLEKRPRRWSKLAAEIQIIWLLTPSHIG